MERLLDLLDTLKERTPELELPIECYESAVAREQHGVELGYWEPLLPQMGVEYVYDPARMPRPRAGSDGNLLGERLPALL
jgi:hypothetical protein